MGETIEKLKQIGFDIKNSWYFRAWGVLWVVGALITIIALSLLIHSDRKVNETWFSFSQTMAIPNFHFRVDRSSSQNFVNMNCEFNGQPLQWVQCERPEDANTDMCRAIHPTQPAVAIHGDRLQRTINCQFMTNGTTGPDGDIMAFELEGAPGDFIFQQTDGAGDTATWFFPNSMLWLIMKKRTFEFNKDITVQIWDTTPIYHSTIFQPNNFNVSVMIGEFLVMNIQPKEMYSGFLVFGAIGGVSFSMLIISTIVMIILGFFLSNNSTFLNSGSSAANPNYSALK